MDFIFFKNVLFVFFIMQPNCHHSKTFTNDVIITHKNIQLYLFTAHSTDKKNKQK